MEKRWTIVASDAVKTEALQAALSINKTICSILVARGLETFEASKKILQTTTFGPARSLAHEGYGQGSYAHFNGAR